MSPDARSRTTIREELGVTLVVEAAAGTGKTTEMIARIIAVIRSGTTTLERIVAVTFTEKAAGEMKLRLRTELERSRNHAATPNERHLLEAALAQLEVARVGTIHSFCADVLKERPIEARVDPLFEVAAEDDQDRSYRQAFDTWFQAALAAPPEGVRRILRRKDPSDLLRDAGASLIDRRDFDGAWRRDPFDRPAAIDGAIAALDELGQIAERGRVKDPLTELCTKARNWLAELARREAITPVRDHDGLEAELTQIGRWYEWKKGSGKGDYADGLPRADVVALKDRVRRVLSDAIAGCEADLAACLSTELWSLIAEYERVKAQSGRLDFLDLLARTRGLLRDDATVRNELQARFTHFYVDEFQDTDPLQVDILMLLCADDPTVRDPVRARIAPGKLFVVGDPKQAIYRFRRADVAVYEAIKRRLLADGARLVHLATSFRSAPSIQAAINAAFEPVMTGADGQAAYVPLEQHRAPVTDQPTVVALPVPHPYNAWGNITNKEIEKSYPDAVGAFVDFLITGSGWLASQRDGVRVPIAARHICLVFKRFQSFGDDLTRPYVRALEARGVPHVLVGGRAFHEREESEAIRNILAAIEWPDDELSVYATLRGPCIAFHDEDLVAFKHAHGRLHPIHWIDVARRAGLSPMAKEVAGALGALGELHRERNRRPIADTLARFLALTRAHAGLAVWPAGEQALANVLRVLDLARRFEARGATSFRAFVDKLAADAERGSKQADATVVEEGTEGVRIMTVHAAKGLEFPVVILCDPTGPLAFDRPSRHVDPARRVWLAPIAGCVPSELREHAAEIVARDRDEAVRLAYVAATRARDLLVIPALGDQELGVERASWIDPLRPVTYPMPATRRTPEPAIHCPPFGDDSAMLRPQDAPATTEDSVKPGAHVPQAGAHRVIWWDPAVLGLDRAEMGGMRQRQILAADTDAAKTHAADSERAHAEWQAMRTYALGAGALQTRVTTSVTDAAGRGVDPSPHLHVAVERTATSRIGRPNGLRFGSLVHAILATVPLVPDATAIREVAHNHGRLVGATPDELAHAIAAVSAALAHPILARAAVAGEVRREVPVVVAHAGALIEGVVDLAFAEAGAWTVVDFKTDDELGDARAAYEVQVRIYATAIGLATNAPVSAVLLVV